VAVPTSDQPAPPVPPAPAGPVDRVRRGAPAGALRLLGAAAGGWLLYLSFPPGTAWYLALPAFALLGQVVRGRSARAGFGLGFVFSLAFLLPLLVWVGALVQQLPWIALSAFESLFVAAAVAGMALVTRLPLWPVWAAAAWLIGEAVRSRVPFGGMPWGRVGFGQPDGPLLPLAALGGVPLLSFATVLAGLALGELVRRAAAREVRGAAAAAAVVALALVAGPLAALVPAAAGAPDRVAVIAAVQGNVPRLGLDFNAQRRAVLDNHVRVTEQLGADVAAGRLPRPDLVLWPENSSDIDPIQNPDAAAQIDRAARAVGVPIMVGTILRNPPELANADGPTATNSTLVWEAGVGPVARNDKRRIQPFGEYMPFRSFFRMFSPYVDRASNFSSGTGEGALDVAGVRVGIAICWEIAFDDLLADSVAAGAQVLAVPSNNATFGFTDMTYQQLAMSRVRAVEFDRAAIVATTSGVSATVTRDGAVTARTGQFEPGVLVDRTVLRDTTTIAARLRSVPEWALVALGAGAVLLAAGRTRAGRTGRRERGAVDG
jgi:apolipoprotein N-acyltransferase